MTIEDFCETRGVSRILHFTTNRGCIGVLHSRALRSRQRLTEDEQLKFVFQPNAASRTKDAAWLDYVNLSIERINNTFFGICSERWHDGRDNWWCVVQFSPEILTHPGVFFSTTNNIYTSVVRGEGVAGIAALYGDKVQRWYGNVVARPGDLPDAYTTCVQAEVLYPGEVSTSWLEAIHVRTSEESDEVAAQIRATGHRDVPVYVNGEIFGENVDEC